MFLTFQVSLFIIEQGIVCSILHYIMLCLQQNIDKKIVFSENYLNCYDLFGIFSAHRLNRGAHNCDCFIFSKYLFSLK